MPDTSDSSTAYGRVVGHGQQTISFAGGLIQSFERPITSVLRRRNAAQSIREQLGEWTSEAFDSNGRLQTPVLKSREFESHINKTNACMNPSGHTAMYGWAHLLYALAIRPGMGVLTWKPRESGSGLEDVRIHVDTDGQTLCHIINLYEIYDGLGRCPSDCATTPDNYNLSFGTIQSSITGGKLSFQFHSGTMDQLEAYKVPFPRPDRYDSALPVGSEVVMAYLNALYFGASTTLYASQHCPLPRLHRESREGILLTSIWFDDASRIRRRITTNGDADKSLINDVVSLAEVSGPCDSILEEVSDRCMLAGQEFSIISGSLLDMSAKDEEFSMTEQLTKALLEGYSCKPIWIMET